MYVVIVSLLGKYWFWIVIFKIGQVSAVLKTQGAQLIFPVALLHAAAFALGYWLSKISFGESTSRTISIECGMQVCICFVSIFVNLWREIFRQAKWYVKNIDLCCLNNTEGTIWLFQYLRAFITIKISFRLEMVEVSFRKLDILNVHFMD